MPDARSKRVSRATSREPASVARGRYAIDVRSEGIPACQAVKRVTLDRYHPVT